MTSVGCGTYQLHLLLFVCNSYLFANASVKAAQRMRPHAYHVMVPILAEASMFQHGTEHLRRHVATKDKKLTTIRCHTYLS
jgi:hypothetical protein